MARNIFWIVCGQIVVVVMPFLPLMVILIVMTLLLSLTFSQSLLVCAVGCHVLFHLESAFVSDIVFVQRLYLSPCNYMSSLLALCAFRHVVTMSHLPTHSLVSDHVELSSAFLYHHCLH